MAEIFYYAICQEASENSSSEIKDLLVLYHDKAMYSHIDWLLEGFEQEVAISLLGLSENQ